MNGGKKSTGRNYFVVILFARSDPGRTQASAAFLFTHHVYMQHDDNLYIGERPRLGVHDSKMSARALLVQVIFQLVFCVLHLRARFIRIFSI